MFSRTSACDCSVQNDLAPDGRNGKPSSTSRSSSPRVAPVSARSVVEAELLAVVADEVEHGQDRLVAGAPQAAAELLEEDGRALGGPEEEDGVDVGEVETLVEEVGGEEDVHPARSKIVRGLLSLGLRVSRR